jgi:hypothetical protein
MRWKEGEAALVAAYREADAFKQSNHQRGFTPDLKSGIIYLLKTCAARIRKVVWSQNGNVFHNVQK